MSDDVNPREQIFTLCKDRLYTLPIWTTIEPNLAIYCSNISNTGKDKDKESIIVALLNIKKLLNANNVAQEYVRFIDEEIELTQQSRQMSTYCEKDDYIDDATIKRHIHISMTNEGIIGIPGKWTYEQCRKLTNGVYRNTGLVKFFISKEQTIKGRIVAEFFSTMQEIPVCAVLRPKKEDQAHINVISLFGETIDAKKFHKLREITASMYVYRFLRSNGAEYVLLSTSKLDIGEYEIDGTVTTKNDNKSLTDSAKMLTKMPFLFCNEARSIITKFHTVQEYAEHVKLLNLSKDNLFNFPFTFTTVSDGVERQHVQRHPSWFKWLMWSWLTHKEKGDSSKYPLHIVIVAPANSGKTLLSNGLHHRTLEHQPVFTGSGSTVKEIVPSFHATPPKAGYFALSHRFAFFDEFFRCVQNVSDDDRRSEALARMNDLLEHQKRTYGSGKGNITVQGTARALMTNNPPRGVRSMEDLLSTFDQSFLSRSLIYFQDDKNEHFRMVRESSITDCETYEDCITSEEFVGLLDFFHSFHAKYDLQRVHEIYKRSIPLLTSTQLGHYEARHRHHIECLIDGLIKTRAIMSCSADFTAAEEDYDRLETVWVHIIKSWVRSEQVKSVPLRFRIKYLPEMCQWVYKLIKDNTTDDHPTIDRSTLTELALKGLDRSSFYASFTILRENKLVDDTDGIRLYFRVVGYTHEEEVRKLPSIVMEE